MGTFQIESSLASERNPGTFRSEGKFEKKPSAEPIYKKKDLIPALGKHKTAGKLFLTTEDKNPIIISVPRRGHQNTASVGRIVQEGGGDEGSNWKVECRGVPIVISLPVKDERPNSPLDRNASETMAATLRATQI